MATKSLLYPLRALAGSTHPRPSLLRSAARTSFPVTATSLRRFHNTPVHPAQEVDYSRFPPGTIRSYPADTTPVGTVPSPAAPEHPHDDAATRHAAFLGEADSDDAFAAAQEINPVEHEPLDPHAVNNSAFLGEADSDDGFVHENEVRPRPVVPLDAQHSAFLGEADSDDGFVAEVDVRGESDHGIRDPSVSALHGESGEQDEHHLP